MITVDANTRRVQAEATDPTASVWVSANAGSGKTYVLARRVIRLLLAGTDPGAILCLTFTKAAAAEMAARVFSILADWTTLPDAALDEALADYDDVPASEAVRIRARRLFARALETPGGLKIQTIHAFCEKLLHQFPFEANVAGAFEVLDDRAAAILIEGAQRQVLARASADEDGRLGRAFARLLDAASDQGIEAALGEIISRRDALAALIEVHGSLDNGLAELRQALDLALEDTEETLRASIVTAQPLPVAAIRRLVESLLASGPKHKAAGEQLAPFLSANTDAARSGAWLAYMLTAAGKVKALGSLAPKSVLTSWPGLEEMLDAERLRIENVLDRIAAARAFDATEALLILGTAVLEAYERGKQLRGALDFQDLVVRTADLLTRSGASSWVHYKLDRGLDHILVDEAQDTSPRQWQVIAGLADEFFAGESARDKKRTFFAVGDEKQSIYSFQGAVPAWFARQRDRFRRAAQAADAEFRALVLNLSFRSTGDVLAAVDAVFAAPDAHRGLAREMQATAHEAARRGEPGRVTLWPSIVAEPAEEPEDWHTPLDRLDTRSPEVRLAERIALTIRGWIDRGERIEASGAPVRAGGILILTRKRGAQTDAINRALKTAGLPVAGADRLKLGGHIAVMDLVALAETVLQPDDDLALAALLKSPLVGLSEDDLFAVAHGRPGSLWQAVHRARLAAAEAAVELLDLWRGRADFMGPHAFFARILGPDGGRKRILARLGAEADEVLDEFLARALAYEQSETPSLQGFTAWMREAATEIKRDADIGRDEIRVMTVHGAKGLEAEIVFLVDTGSAAVHASHDPKIVALADDPDDASGAPLAYIAPSARRPQRLDAALETLRERAGEEYRRLLYVALTRARDRLVICGTRKTRSGSDPLWQDIALTALEPGARVVPVTLGTETFDSLEWRRDWSAVPQTAADVATAPARPAAPLPAFLASPPPTPPLVAARIQPSDTNAAGSGAAGAIAAEQALARGVIVHRLLQALPEHPAAARQGVARAYLDAIAEGWPETDRDRLAADLAGLIDGPDFAPLFGPGSRPEVAIAGTLVTAKGALAVSGRIDRLVVEPSRILIADFKTNASPPVDINGVAPAHIAQLALYRAVIARLYPVRTVEAALVFTEAPRLITVPADQMDEHISRITAS
ncbi:double-strand break repair helicase AddA [Mesorhizobium sp. BR1-1-16]|uniref:double-strand break repair helicase AddA n=1 Tax=Mesorhizobium sp. BR1-1-16 TaxID=2876653 RepID=UPI001CCDD4AA|nr:double-strand break repair helicase AddA [Mesorhizobium sp. BR1-1-16]